MWVLPPPIPLHQYTGSASGLYQSKTATSGPCTTHNITYRYMQTHAHMHTRTQRDTDACMDGCTHNVSWYYIIAGDKLITTNDGQVHWYTLTHCQAGSSGGGGISSITHDTPIHSCVTLCNCCYGVSGWVSSSGNINPILLPLVRDVTTCGNDRKCCWLSRYYHQLWFWLAGDHWMVYCKKGEGREKDVSRGSKFDVPAH